MCHHFFSGAGAMLMASTVKWIKPRANAKRSMNGQEQKKTTSIAHENDSGNQQQQLPSNNLTHKRCFMVSGSHSSELLSHRLNIYRWPPCSEHLISCDVIAWGTRRHRMSCTWALVAPNALPTSSSSACLSLPSHSTMAIWSPASYPNEAIGSLAQTALKPCLD